MPRRIVLLLFLPLLLLLLLLLLLHVLPLCILCVFRVEAHMPAEREWLPAIPLAPK